MGSHPINALTDGRISIRGDPGDRGPRPVHHHMMSRPRPPRTCNRQDVWTENQRTPSSIEKHCTLSWVVGTVQLSSCDPAITPDFAMSNQKITCLKKDRNLGA